jgi:integrase
MNPADVRKPNSVIDDTRNRPFIFLLLRTGMRIREALGLRLNDLDIRDRRIHLFEEAKTAWGGST